MSGRKKRGKRQQSPSADSYSVDSASEPTTTTAPATADAASKPTASNNDVLITMFRELLTESRDRDQALISSILTPKTELITFNGDPLKYHPFISSFTNTVENKCADAGSCLNVLLQYCSPNVKECLSCCLVMPPQHGFARAKEILRERFGDNDVIAQAWVNKILDRPLLKNDSELRSFADDLRTCQETLANMGYLAEMETRASLKSVIEKLPKYLQSRWLKVNYDIKDQGRQPNLRDIIAYIERVSKEVNDPVFGHQHSVPQTPTQENIQNKPNKAQHSKPKFSHAAEAKPNHVANQSQFTSNHANKPTPTKIKQCPACSQSHYLNQCGVFRSQAVADRMRFMIEKGLCVNCFLPGHDGQLCTKPWRCNIDGCGAKHNRWLHPTAHSNQNPATTATPTNVTCGYTGAGQCEVALPILPVTIRGLGTQKCVTTYALLDSGSNQSFCSSRLIEQLQLPAKRENIVLTTLDHCEMNVETAVVDLEVSDITDQRRYNLRKVMSRPTLNINLDSYARSKDVTKWKHLEGLPLPEVKSDEVDLLIGQDASDLLIPLETRLGQPGEPYATRTMLGWTLNGPIRPLESKPKLSNAHFIKLALDQQVEKFWKLEDLYVGEDQTLSVSDRKVLQEWNNSITKDDQFWSLNIPFKQDPPNLPNNIHVAKHRLDLLAKKLSKDEALKAKYTQSMDDYLQKGYAEPLPADASARHDGAVWYLPHHAVFHPRKPDKLRVVFDCAARYEGLSLNDCVHQGPDLTNKLLGVLLRFRQQPIAIMSDIEGMFNQVKVNEANRDVLRFLWWPNGDLSKPPDTYRMTTHLFGGVWSPSCASYALKHTAEAYGSEFDVETVKTVDHNFYVDDCVTSVSDESSAIRLVEQLTKLLSLGGFHLTKWISNSRQVMKSIPTEEWSKATKSLDLDNAMLPSERTLGVLWDVESDEFHFDTNLVENVPNTKRGLLSATSSVYDPLGFVSPFILRAKALFQELCRRKIAWDDELPADIENLWIKWISDLSLLCDFHISRCLKPNTLCEPIEAQLHHFSDASELAYGATTYLRLTDANRNVHCSIVIAKAKLAPLKTTTIPRLELLAATVSVKHEEFLRKNLDYTLKESVFWTDSVIVLQYLRNEDKRFKTFVANRIAYILSQSTASQWKHVDSDQNPADDVSRGLSAAELVTNKRWLNGPSFLYNDENLWPVQPQLKALPEDAELKLANVHTVAATGIQYDPIESLIERHSSWFKLKKAVGYLLRVKKLLCNQPTAKMKDPFTVEEMEQAEQAILRYTQCKWLTEHMKQCDMKKLSPVCGDDGLVRVGGRLSNAPISRDAKHPVIIPRGLHIGTLIVQAYHQTTAHSGIERTLAEVRQKYWIVRCRSLVKQLLSKCIPCRRRKAPLCTQYLSDLPADRVTPSEPPFARVGVDYFGPFLVKRGRSEQKRYGCLFTCLSTRAIHIEVAHSLDTDSFINALQRFIARRGKPTVIRSDNGSNFVGAQRELHRALEDWNKIQVEQHLLQQDIQWYFNPPASSHMGGVWERQIRTVRAILLNLVNSQTLDDERLQTFMCIAENIVNGRPLTKLSDDPNDLTPLTPNHLLLLRSGPDLPPGHFVKQDIYRKRWRQVQHMADVFWSRWLKEYLPTLQQRQKWLTHTRNFKSGDLVLVLHENVPRNQWPMGLILNVNTGPDELVRSVQIKTSEGVYTRPITKLCLLEACDNN